MADEKTEEKKQRTDSWFEKLLNWISQTIRSFAAAIFVLFGVGALYGAYAASSPYFPFLMVLPFLLGALAYYSRDFAVVVIVIIALLLFMVIF